jgi:E3 ubiquitin-protein ligase HUWE1
MPVVMAFKEEGGLNVLNAMLRVFSRCVDQRDDVPEESSKPKVAAFGLKKIMDLYYILSNGKYITDANASYNLQRNTDRAQTVPNIYTQSVVDMRALILPAITELWNSPVVEKVPDQTAKRLVDILKLIALAEHEAPQTPKDRVGFVLQPYNLCDEIERHEANSAGLVTFRPFAVRRCPIQLGRRSQCGTQPNWRI